MNPQIDVKGKSFKEVALEYLANQGRDGAAVSILGTISVGGYYIAKYAIETGVPMHLRQIQEGYQEIAEKNNAVVSKLEETMRQATLEGRETREAILRLCDKQKVECQ